MQLDALVAMSQKYGKNPDYVLAGGGNTSMKDTQTLYVKASGCALADITEAGFVALSRAALRQILDRAYPAEHDAREAAVLGDMMAARLPGETGRPSVEALLHEVLPFPMVLHVHPAAVGGMVCGRTGRAFFEEALADDGIWIPPAMPGYTLARAVAQEIGAFHARTGLAPAFIYLENHGVFIGGENTEEIDRLVERMDARIAARLVQTPDTAPVHYERETAALLAPAIRSLATPDGRGSVVFCTNRLIARAVADADSFSRIHTAFTPDHMVYCGTDALFLNVDTLDGAYLLLPGAAAAFEARHGRAPRIIGVRGLGFYACAPTRREAENARLLFLDAAKLALYADSFGGGKPMPDDLIRFIAGWEVERYRASVAAGHGDTGRLAGRVALITGAAQGFGEGIAHELAQQGAYVLVADLNIEGAAAVAQVLNSRHGAHTARAVYVNVADEEQLRDMAYVAALEYGGIDLFISNAGILRAGGLEEMSLSTFELMTQINYTAFFLGTKYVSRLMRTAHRFRPALSFDIIQINSKSGLSGSNRNFAYAGGKFGGIGLVQSFALELVDAGIKVNAVCPGNFFDGPLWADPERGLFVQYLRSGKVPGAKTIDDVKRYYESRVPMGRGCLVRDVARAIFYLVEQEYETGQALPVTGGQEMLH